MKKFLSIIIAAAMLLTASTAMAEDDDREYTSEGGYFTVNKYDAKIYHAPDGSRYSYLLRENGDGVSLSCLGINGKELIFPSTVNGVPVTAAHSEASSNILEKVIIPESVKRIGWFNNYKNLKSVSLPETAEYIEFSAFENDEALESIDLPSGITVLEHGLFKNCTSLKKIEIPSTVTEIQDNAFSGCSSLEYVDIPPSVEKIGLGAFEECKALKKVDFHEGLLAIGKCAFMDCPIETLKFPSTLVKLGGSCFLRNRAVKSVVFPENVNVIEGDAFGSSSLESVSFTHEPESLGYGAFDDSALKDVMGLSRAKIMKFWMAFKNTPWQATNADDADPFLIDEDGMLVAYIGKSTDAVIPETVKSIGENAFESRMTSVKIPNTVTRIEKAAFYGCDKLTEITIPASVKRIGQLAFSHCYRLKNITFEYSNESLQLDNCAFQFTLVSPETLITNNRRYSNQKTAFQNTYFDPDYVPMMENGKYVDESYTEPPKATPKPTAKPDATAAPAVTEAPAATAAPSEPPQDINVRGGETITVSLGDKEITFLDARPYIDENGRTKIPIRAVAEALGCKVDWDAATGTAAITRGSRTVYITIGKDTLQVNNEMITMDTTAEIQNDRTYIPLRFVGEALGMTVNWKG